MFYLQRKLPEKHVYCYRFTNADTSAYHFWQVFAEVFRILKPGGVFIVSFSNRMFYEKAISAWREGTAYSRVQLVVQYFLSVDGFTQPEVVKKLPMKSETSPLDGIMRLFGLSQSDPFYAVISYRNFKPSNWNMCWSANTSNPLHKVVQYVMYYLKQ